MQTTQITPLKKDLRYDKLGHYIVFDLETVTQTNPKNYKQLTVVAASAYYKGHKFFSMVTPEEVDNGVIKPDAIKRVVFELLDWINKYASIQRVDGPVTIVAHNFMNNPWPLLIFKENVEEGA